MRQAIEPVLFAYYIKYGNEYLTDALKLIIGVLSWVRYNKSPLRENMAIEWVKNSRIVMIIETSTSPTFCLAKMKRMVDNNIEYRLDGGIGGVRKRYFDAINKTITDVLDKAKESKYEPIVNSEIEYDFTKR